MVSEDQLKIWASSPSETEEDKCRNAVYRVTTAINRAYGSDVSIFLQGSYKNRTNVRKDSDVDIVVRHNRYYFGDTTSLTEEDKKAFNEIPNSSFTFADFKNGVQSVMEQEFGSSEVERKNKCIRVNGSSYRVNADVIPCFLHKRLITTTSASVEGIEFLSDYDGKIHSFPEQHYDNGVQKNKLTTGSYKGIVRILKNARNLLIDEGTIAKDAISSHFLECLVWNVPDLHLADSSYISTTSAAITKIWGDMGDANSANNYAEVSDLKWLFRGTTKRTPAQAKVFMENAWRYFGF